MNKVLVVGGGGYVGCVLVDALLEKGYSVKVVDRLFFGREPVESLVERGVDLQIEDMRDIDERQMEDCGAVINIGGLSNDPTAEFYPKANIELNTTASVRLAQVAKRAGVPRYVFASSCSIYDRGVGEETLDFLQDEESEVEPRGAYATSKLEAERGILPLADGDFTPVAFRKGTIFGFSPRMRYDLVVNTFVKDAMSSGIMTLRYGGAMWRPLIDINDVVRGYVQALECEADLISGQVFNLSAGNLRISELGLRTQRALADLGVKVELQVDYGYRLLRNYRVSTQKILKTLGFQPKVTVEDSIERMVREITKYGYTDFSHPRYYNIEWMKLLEEGVGIVKDHGYVLSKPEWRDGGPSSNGSGDADRELDAATRRPARP
jgi:nucleoside-diphosphate-sugar epimerase